MKVLKARRTTGDEALKMEKAYMDKETGRVACCWSANNRDQVVALFKRAGVLFESIAMVEEVHEEDLT